MLSPPAGVKMLTWDWEHRNGQRLKRYSQSRNEWTGERTTLFRQASKHGGTLRHTVLLTGAQIAYRPGQDQSPVVTISLCIDAQGHGPFSLSGLRTSFPLTIFFPSLKLLTEGTPCGLCTQAAAPEGTQHFHHSSSYLPLTD